MLVDIFLYAMIYRCFQYLNKITHAVPSQDLPNLSPKTLAYLYIMNRFMVIYRCPPPPIYNSEKDQCKIANCLKCKNVN